MLKRLISKIFPEIQGHKMPFWQWIEEKNKIKRATKELDEHFTHVCINADFHGCNPKVTLSDFEKLYKLAKIQQSLLTTKNGKIL